VSPLFLLLDVRANPAGPVPWAALILLLAIVFVLSVAFVAALVALLIWLKRRKIKQTEVSRR
jgi:hypothetical protein